MMKWRNILLCILALSFWGCERAYPDTDAKEEGNGIWEFAMTRGGEPVDSKVTYRASLLDNSNGNLLSDGTYCGYHKAQGWLYPCAADDDTGEALDTGGNIVDWNDSEWFEKIDKDSRHGLRAAKSQKHVLTLSSPAVRMKKFLVQGTADTWHWGFPVDRKTELYIGNAIKDLSVTATWVDNRYIFPVVSDSHDGKLYDRRAKVTVKVACGALMEADINSVYFKNVISSAYYMPYSMTYENATLDGGYSDPLRDYYTTNTYDSLGDGDELTSVIGDKLSVPADEPDIRLTQREDPAADFTDADEWVKSSNEGKILTAIQSFPIMSLDYSTLDGDQYRYKDLIPEIIILTGTKGNIRSTVSLAADLDPMTEYLVMIYLSTASVQATLYVAEWDEGSNTTVTFRKSVDLPVNNFVADSWDVNPDHPIDDGKITNPA